MAQRTGIYLALLASHFALTNTLDKCVISAQAQKAASPSRINPELASQVEAKRGRKGYLEISLQTA